MSILVVMEQRPGDGGQPAWNRQSFEALAAAQQFGAELNRPVFAALLGRNIRPLANELKGWKLECVHAVEHDLLADYTADAYTSVLAELIAAHRPDLVLFPHTYQVRDFAPKLATRLERPLVSDVVGHKVRDGEIILVRQALQGKLNVDVRFQGAGPHFASLQAGAYPADRLQAGSARIEHFIPQLNHGLIRTKPLERFRDSERVVDLSAAEIIVAVGRGIKDAASLPLMTSLAEVLGGELAASRPICDAGWLPMERQVGSSGQTVAPKLYIAVGISGAIQHLVGMKGARTVVAINKDAGAPIFEAADYGIVGDLFAITPALIEEIRKAKG